MGHPTVSTSRTIRATAVAAAALLVSAAAAPTQAGLVISEVLFNEVGSDTTGEWIEIYNSGPGPIDLTNYKIGDEEASGGTGTTEAMHTFPAGASIAEGEVQVVAVTASRFFTVYGFLPTYEATESNAGVPNLGIYAAWDPDGGAFNMANGNDQAAILDGADALVDGVNWGNTTYLNPGLAQPVADGVSYYRTIPQQDTNTAGDWQLGTPSSPGIIPEPASFATLGTASALVALRRRRRKLPGS